MALHRMNSLLFLAFFSSLLCPSFSYQFLVGGRDGWVIKPSEDYIHWASRLRFQVNDTLLFKYDSGSDSVVEVNKDDYDKCNAANPITKLDDGNSVFTLNRSGPFYFISGNKSDCDQGQKLIVVVLAIRPPPPSPSSPPLVPSPTASPPQGPSSAVSPPGHAPAASPFSPSPSTGAPAPVTSPPSPSPGSLSPASPEPSAAPGSPGASPSGSPGSSTPADADAPTSQGRSLAAPPCSSCAFLMSAASVVLSVGVFV